jgi:hypothetical protein
MLPAIFVEAVAAMGSSAWLRERRKWDRRLEI